MRVPDRGCWRGDRRSARSQNQWGNCVGARENLVVVKRVVPIQPNGPSHQGAYKIVVVRSCSVEHGIGLRRYDHACELAIAVEGEVGDRRGAVKDAVLCVMGLVDNAVSSDAEGVSSGVQPETAIVADR